MTPSNIPKWAGTAIAILTAITALVVAIANNGDKIVNIIHAFTPHQAAELQLQQSTAQNPACNPAIGAGKMGTCAPQTLTPPGLQTRFIHGIRGVDLSSYQGCGDLSGISFAFVKLNESTGYRNQSAACTAARARARHLPLGGYDFLRPGRTSPTAEAATFVGMYRNLRLRGPAVADVEVNDRGLSQSGMRSYVSRWFAYVRGHLKNATKVIYTGAWFWTPQVGGSAGTSNLWVSAYANSFIRPVGFRSALIWQYSNGQVGPVPRIHGYDSDVFLGSRAKFRAAFVSHSKPKPISKTAKQNCRELNRLRRIRKHNLRRHHRPTLTAKQRKRAIAIKKGERKNHVICDKKGAHR